jgi:hypothetical protein
MLPRAPSRIILRYYILNFYKRKPLGTRTAGRPKSRWEDVMKDLKLLKIENWTTCFLNREEWRRIVDVKIFKNEVVIP